MPAQFTVGISLKMYFGHRQAREWFAEVSERVRTNPAVTSGVVTLFVLPTYLQIPVAITAFSGTPVRVGAQDVATADGGAYTGEVSAAELAEVGATLAEVGHAERRRLFGENDMVIAAKASAALRHGLTPIVCVGERQPMLVEDASAATAAQLRASLSGAPDGAVIVAYEPVWTIGASQAAPLSHIICVTRVLREAVDALPGRAGSAVIYGGSAGPGLLTSLSGATDGVFLGRFGHAPDALIDVLDEAAREVARRGRLGRQKTDS